MGFRDLALFNDTLLANKLGACYKINTPFFIRSSRQGSFLIALSWKLEILDQCRMHG